MWRTVVHGKPAPKGSLQPFLQWVGGKPVARVREDASANFKSWRKLLKQVGASIQLVAGEALREGPLRLHATVTLERPASVKPASRWWPWKQSEDHGDVDKLARAIFDGIADSGLFTNDAQICHLEITKCYPDTEGVPDRLDHPGAVIRIGPIKDEPVSLVVDTRHGVAEAAQVNGGVRLALRQVFTDDAWAVPPEGMAHLLLTTKQALQLARALEHEARAAERTEDQEVLL